MLTFVLILAMLVAIYWFWIRPILKSRPAFRKLYDTEKSLFAALREKLKGIKQRLSSAIVIAASAAAGGYDFLTPIINGIDVTPLTSMMPSWAWPLILIAVTALFQFLRNLADKRHSVELNESSVSAQKS
jgi:type II secretory pathway component PulM